MLASDRDRLRATFDAAAATYQEARPDYPEELYEDLAAAAGVTPADRVLEIGCATGKSTLPLARRGLRITCVEPGPALAAQARRNLAAFPGVDVVTSDFESWTGGEPGGYDLVAVATAWHWLDPQTRYQRAWELLRPGGHLALWRQEHVLPQEGGDPFFDELQPVYDEIGEGLPGAGTWDRPGQVPGWRAEIEATGLFGDVREMQYAWGTRYDAGGYIALLETFSGHLDMEPWQKDRLYGAMRARLAERPDGTLLRHWGVVMNVARRLP